MSISSVANKSKDDLSSTNEQYTKSSGEHSSNSDIKKGIDAYLPSLEAKYFISHVIKTLKLTNFDPNDDTSNIQLLDCMISKLTQKLLSLDDSNQPKNYSLSSSLNRQLLFSGYIKQNFHQFIPNDIMQFIFKFYETSFTWFIEGESMEKFRNCKFKDVMHGPQFAMNGITFELTLCPQGWIRKGYIACYLELMDKLDAIKAISANITMCIKELNLVYKASKTWNKKADGTGINDKMMPFADVKMMDSLTIDCYIDVLYIEYDPVLKLDPLILSPMIPVIKDTEFIWNIDDILLTKIKNTGYKWIYQSDNFYDNCLMLEAMVYQENMKLGVKLLRLAFGIREYIVSIKWTIYCDNQQPVTKEKQRQQLKLGNPKWSLAGYSLEALQEINVLSFKANIKVHDAVKFA